MQKIQATKAERTARLIELGAGTGICGLLIAKNVPHVAVSLTDLPQLQRLLSRNANRLLFGHGNDLDLKEFAPSTREFDLQSSVEVFELDWADDSGSHGTFDVVLGADVVATLYDPVALAQSIHRLCHAETLVYISFKERLSSVHRAFESEMERLFSKVRVIDNITDGKTLSSNHNPDVHVLIAEERLPATALPLD